MADDEDDQRRQHHHQQHPDDGVGEELLHPVQVVEEVVPLHRGGGHQGEDAVLLAVEGHGDAAQLLPGLHRGLHGGGVHGVLVLEVLLGHVVGQQGGNLPLRISPSGMRVTLGCFPRLTSTSGMSRLLLSSMVWVEKLSKPQSNRRMVSLK